MNAFFKAFAISIFAIAVSSAEAVAQAAPAAAQPGMLQFVMQTIQFAAVGFVVYYFLVVFPRNAQETEHKKFLTGLKKNDEVVTTGGLLGKIVQVKDDAITLELSSSVKVRVLPSHVRSRSTVDKSSEVADNKAANTKE